MKPLTTFLIISFCILLQIKGSAHFANSGDTSLCLEIEGIILNASEGAHKTCTVELVLSGKVVEKQLLKPGKKQVKFLLRKNRQYTIRISKLEHITKLISIDTRMSKQNYDLYSFSFETRLIPESVIEKADRDYLDFPVALVYYDERKDLFVHDKAYAGKLKKELALN